MEELQANLFVTSQLPTKFDPRLWARIAREEPQLFQARQAAAYERITRDASLKEKYFERFERNHLTLYGWYLLVSREKVELQPYLFRKLLQRTPSFHHKKHSRNLHCTFPHRLSRTEPNELQKLMVTPSPSKEKEKLVFQQIDSHQLYLQTFAACRGQRYIPYDHTRHMRSGVQKEHYNAFIRQGHKRNQSNPLESQNSLSKFEEWGQEKEKTSQFAFGKVLGNSALNSERGLKSLLRRRGGQKLVFVNHQRKPVNYYLRRGED